MKIHVAAFNSIHYALAFLLLSKYFIYGEYEFEIKLLKSLSLPLPRI